MKWIIFVCFCPYLSLYVCLYVWEFTPPPPRYLKNQDGGYIILVGVPYQDLTFSLRGQGLFVGGGGTILAKSESKWFIGWFTSVIGIFDFRLGGSDTQLHAVYTGDVYGLLQCKISSAPIQLPINL